MGTVAADAPEPHAKRRIAVSHCLTEHSAARALAVVVQRHHYELFATGCSCLDEREK